MSDHHWGGLIGELLVVVCIKLCRRYPISSSRRWSMVACRVTACYPLFWETSPRLVHGQGEMCMVFSSAWPRTTSQGAPIIKWPAVLVACTVFIAGNASAQVFKCTDGAGKTACSDAPCSHRGQRLDQIKLRSNTLDGAHERRAVFQDRVEREGAGAPGP